jgi:hypothetical protein
MGVLPVRIAVFWRRDMRAYTILVPGNTEASGTILPVEYGLLSDKGWLDLSNHKKHKSTSCSVPPINM